MNLKIANPPHRKITSKFTNRCVGPFPLPGGTQRGFVVAKRSFAFLFLPLLLFFSANCLAEIKTPGLPKYDSNFFKSKKEYLWILKGREFANKNKYGKAIELFGKAIEHNPQSTAYYWQGLAHVRWSEDLVRKAAQPNQEKEGSAESDLQTHVEGALNSFASAAGIFTKVDYIHYQLGKTLLDYKNDPVKASESLLKAIELNPREMVYRIDLARCYLTAKNFPSARKEAETALTDSRPVVQSQANALLGEIELEQKNLTKAVEQLKLSLSLNPGLYTSHYHLAKAYRYGQQLAEAKESHENFIRLFSPATPGELDLLRDSKEELSLLEAGRYKKK